jgi:hypothetical protein
MSSETLKKLRETLPGVLLADLEELSAKRRQCAEMRDKLPSGETKSKLQLKYEELDDMCTRVALCSDILKGKVSVEISPDFMTVKFPR